MRDLLPSEAYRQSALVRRVMRAFELYGYERVSVPAFEYADVLERGLGSLGPDEVLRFVEPETGEVVALRPDMTPQIARLLATRLSDAPRPCRLCYEGSVLRRPRARARRHRQMPQAGIELIGSAAADGDVEVLTVAAAAVRAAGIAEFVVDIGHAKIAGSLLECAPEPARPGLIEAMSLKDSAELDRRASSLGLERTVARALVEIVTLCGGPEIWPRAESVLAATPAEGALKELRGVCERILNDDPALRIVVDLGETRHFAYYTGMMFQLLAEGPGAPIGSGGRYDGLLAQFAAARPAAGFALDLDYVSWALRAAGTEPASRLRVLVSAESRDVGGRALALLRAHGVASALGPPVSALEYASAWRYSHVLELGDAGSTTLHALGPSSRQPIDGKTLEQVVQRALSELGVLAPAAGSGQSPGSG
jgi:ATP phosphoribosyltransferase regulatory subunit